MRHSAQENIHPYMKVGFIFNPSNQFWNRQSETLIDKKSGHVDQVLASSEKAKDYFSNFVMEMDKRAAKRTHLL